MTFGRIAIPGTPSYAEFLRWNSARKPGRDPDLTATVARIVGEVLERGEEAALDYAREFDAPNLGSLYASEEEIRDAAVPVEHFQAIRLAIDRVQRLHERQVEALTKGMTRATCGWHWRTPASGTPSPVTGFLGQRILPLRRIGTYVPGGSASYPSSVIMNAVPAKVAGVEECIVATPARKDGTLNPAVLVAAREVGARTILKVGGAAAVALLARGTDRFEGVEKVVGPGNRYVNEAKRQLWGAVGVDGYAGPSEVCVLVDESADAAAAARDLLTQIEHAPDNLGFLVSTGQAKAEDVHRAVERMLGEFSESPTGPTLLQALENLWTIVAKDESEACAVVDLIAPEHLAIATKDPDRTLLRIRNAGGVSLGEHTPQSAGDYLSGPSHTLPTSRGARFGSPLSVLDFWKVQSVARLSANDLRFLRPAIRAFGEMEGLPVHGSPNSD